MKRLAILTAGGDTPALNATLYGAAKKCCEIDVELIGLIGGYRSLFDDTAPHVALNPSGVTIPELDPTWGGTIIGSSRHYVDASDDNSIRKAITNLERLKVDGLICVGGDGTINAMQALSSSLPVALAPKTIDNDLGLNYANEGSEASGEERRAILPSEMINYATPGYATAVFVAADGLSRVRTTAESHSRVAIVEVMGRHSGYIAVGASYGQPDIVLIPECAIDPNQLCEKVREIYKSQKHAVIVCGEGVVDADGNVIGSAKNSTDPAGNLLLSGAAEGLKRLLVENIPDSFFQQYGSMPGSSSSIFTRKVGHTQRGGRPLLFDRYYAAQLGSKAVDLLNTGQSNVLSTLQYDSNTGFSVESLEADELRDSNGIIHARKVHPCFYDAAEMRISRLGVEYLLPIFENAIASSDMEAVRQSVFDSGNLHHKYASVQVRIARRTQHLT